MMMKFLWSACIVLFVCACSTTRKVPEGKLLLNSCTIKSDDKDINKVALRNYVRQKPNSSFLFFGKTGLSIYNLASGDSTKRTARILRKIGQPPVIYNNSLTQTSADQIKKELYNMGYLNADVTLNLKEKGKRMDVTYNIKSGKRYRIRKYELALQDSTILKIINRNQKNSLIKKDDFFDRSLLEKERMRLTTRLRNTGYYTFSKDELYYKADTTLNSHQVDLFLSLNNLNDSINKQYKIRNVMIVSKDDSFENERCDTTIEKGIKIVHDASYFLKNITLLSKNSIKPNSFFSDELISKTYEEYNNLGAVKKTDINLRSVASTENIKYLDAEITLIAEDPHSFQVGLDGTESAGNIGFAPNISYNHQNFLNRAEIFNLKLKGAYEFISEKQNSGALAKSYYEYGIESSLTFPRFLFPFIGHERRNYSTARTQVLLAMNIQNRSEYVRQFFNTNLNYQWRGKSDQLFFSLDLLNINYVRMPWKSSEFIDYLNNDIFRETYRDQLIAVNGLSLTFQNKQKRNTSAVNNFMIKYHSELGGTLPRLVKNMGGAQQNANGEYEIVGIPYSEYWKNEINASITQHITEKQTLAYHLFAGVAKPFGNSNVIPFEKRYFSGGSSSLRGWNTRSLGPGSYKRNDSTSFVNQVGDIKLDINIEYRNKVSKYVELAAFVDCGNIWTIQDYQGQEGGKFEFSKFYKEIAMSYGIGLRLDFDFFLIRFDTGMKAYNPALDQSERFILLDPKLKNMAWHFAIGYPF